jgi:hypothetical protein
MCVACIQQAGFLPQCARMEIERSETPLGTAVVTKYFDKREEILRQDSQVIVEKPFSLGGRPGEIG